MKKIINSKDMVGGDKEDYTNLHMDENDDISPHRGTASTTFNTVVDDENGAYEMEEEDLNSKLPKEDKLSLITTQDGNSKGNLFLYKKKGKHGLIYRLLGNNIYVSI